MATLVGNVVKTAFRLPEQKLMDFVAVRPSAQSLGRVAATAVCRGFYQAASGTDLSIEDEGVSHFRNPKNSRKAFDPHPMRIDSQGPSPLRNAELRHYAGSTAASMDGTCLSSGIAKESRFSFPLNGPYLQYERVIKMSRRRLATAPCPFCSFPTASTSLSHTPDQGERSALRFLSSALFAGATIGLCWHSKKGEDGGDEHSLTYSAGSLHIVQNAIRNFLRHVEPVRQKLLAMPSLLSPSVARCAESMHGSGPATGGMNGVIVNGGASHDFHPMWRSEENRPFDRKMEDALLFCGNSNPTLASEVADRLSTKLGKVSVKRFADGEVCIQFLDSLRGKDVYIIQPTSPPVNEHLMELLLMVSTCRRASAKKITAVIPYYGYARQDRKLSSRVPISAADVARMIEAMGVDRVVAVDLHCGQIQGFFGPRVPVDNLEAQIIGLDYIQSKNLHKPVIVSPDAGGVYRARKFQEGLLARGFGNCGLAMLIKQRACANEIERMDLVGSVDGSDVIIVDDMIDTAGTLCEAARELRKHGAKRIFAFATHGLFSGPAIGRIEKSPLEEVIVTNTISSRPEVTSSSRISTLSMSVLVADAIRRIHQKESLNDLFNVKG